MAVGVVVPSWWQCYCRRWGYRSGDNSFGSSFCELFLFAAGLRLECALNSLIGSHGAFPYKVEQSVLVFQNQLDYAKPPLLFSHTFGGVRWPLVHKALLPLHSRYQGYLRKLRGGSLSVST